MFGVILEGYVQLFNYVLLDKYKFLGCIIILLNREKKVQARYTAVVNSVNCCRSLTVVAVITPITECTQSLKPLKKSNEICKFSLPDLAKVWQK